MRERPLSAFVAGILAGALLVLLFIGIISCESTGETGPAWMPIRQGEVRINLPESVVVIQFRANLDQTFFWYRILVYIKPKPKELKPEPMGPTT